MGKACAHAQGVQHAAAQLDAVDHRAVGVIDVAVDQLGGADPLLAAEGQGVVLGHVLEHRLSVDADRVVGELIAVDELFDAHLAHVLDQRQDALQICGVIAAEGVRRTRARDGFDDQGHPHSLGSLTDLSHGGCALAAGHPKPSGQDSLLHQLLVAKTEHGVAGHTLDAEQLAHPGGQQHHGLPVALNPVDVQLVHGAGDGVGCPLLGEELWYAQVRRQGLLHIVGQALLRSVADAQNAGAHLGQTPGKVTLLGRVCWGDEDDLHGVSPGAGAEGRHVARAGGLRRRGPERSGQQTPAAASARRSPGAVRAARRWPCSPRRRIGWGCQVAAGGSPAGRVQGPVSRRRAPRGL